MRSSNDTSTLAGKMRIAGTRSIRFWVPDTRSPEFIEQVRQQCISLRSDPAEKEALRFTEDAASCITGWE